MSEPRRILSGRFAKAVAYAVELHANQARKGTTIPYVTHLLSVCALVLEDGGTEDETIATLLHDGPEDQGGRAVLDEIGRRFGPEVAAMVDGLSDTMEDPKPPWRERKEAYLERLRGEPQSVLRISLADKLHNLRSIAVDGDSVWDRFNAPKAEQAWYFGELLAVFEVRLAGSQPARVSPAGDRSLQALTDAADRIDIGTFSAVQVVGIYGESTGRLSAQ